MVKRNIIKKRIMIIYFIIISALSLILIRLSYVKIVKAEEYAELALDLWTRSAPIIGQRGNIYDCNGKIIVGNRLTPTIIAIPRQVKNPEDAAEKISSILGVQKSAILKHLRKNVSVEIIKPEAQKISIESALQIAKLKIAGIYIVGDTSRYYPYGSLLAQVVGIVGIDNQGISGLEYIYEDYLKGTGGAIQIFTDAHGETMDDLSSYYKSGSSGADLYLTINLDIQLSLERVMSNSVVRYNPTEVMGIVMNPQTSEVLAMASRPTFDPGNYQDYDPEIYDRNLPIWKSFEPGSTFKICTFSAGIEENVFKLDETFYDPGYYIVDGTRIKDWKAGGHGSETFLEVLQNSCNPGFITIGLRLGKERLFKYIRDYGYGTKTGIDLLGESSGILFNTDKIGNVELATSSFGQGNSVTAIQLLNASCAAVNGGYLRTPYVLQKIVKDGEVLLEKQPSIVRQVISNETSKIMAASLESVVAQGTGRGGYIEGYRVGGKTGTAQIAHSGSYLSGRYILSFLGIGPMDNPQVACYIAITEPKNTIQYGGVVAAPMVKEVMSECFTILNVPKSDGGIDFLSRYYIDKRILTVTDYIGMKINRLPYADGFQFIIYGEGDRVIAQLPEAGEKLIEGGYIILYT